MVGLPAESRVVSHTEWPMVEGGGASSPLHGAAFAALP